MKKFLKIAFFTFLFVSCASKPEIIVTRITQEEFSNLVVRDKKVNDSGILQGTNESLEDEYLEAEIEAETEEVNLTSVQLDVLVPDSSDYVYYDAILPNNYYSFTAFQNGCEVFFDAVGIESFVCYINETRLDTKKICEYGFAKVDISSMVKNGRNIIYVSNIAKTKKSARLAIRIPYPTLTKSQRNIKGVNYAAFQLVDEILNAQVADGFPSAQLLVIKDGVIIKNATYGKIYNDERFSPEAEKVTRETLYDLASNTKMYATLFAVQRLVSEGKLSIHDKVVNFFPDFADAKNARYTGKKNMTIENLLTHSSGFPAGGAYYNKTVVKNAPASERRAITLEQILSNKLASNVGTEVLYSDINFMLLSFIVEKITGQNFDEYVENQIYKPLGLERICFKPTEHGFSLSEIAGTEYGLNRSKGSEKFKGFAHGHVHDPESFVSMNEVSGHAGLFANAESLGVLAQVIINGGGYGNVCLFDKNTVNTFLGLSQYGHSYALGWRMQNIDAYRWAFSTMASPETYGHTGWTGTLTVIDTENNIVIILLTNAKHSPYVASQKYEGDYYTTKNYGAITSIIYSAFQSTDMEYFSSQVIELVTKKYEMILTQKGFKNAGSYKDLHSLMAVVKKRSKASQTLRTFLKSKLGKEIEAFLAANLN